MDAGRLQSFEGPCRPALGRRPARPGVTGRGRRCVVVNAQADLQQRITDIINPAKEALESARARATGDTVAPHFGTSWATDSLKSLQSSVSQATSSAIGPVEVPQWLRDAQKQTETLEKVLQQQLEGIRAEVGHSTAAEALRAAKDSIGQLRSSIAQQVDRIVSSQPAVLGTSAGQNVEPHFGTHAIQRLAEAASTSTGAAAIKGYLEAARAAGLSAQQQLQDLAHSLTPALSLEGAIDGRVFTRLSEWLGQLPNLLAKGPSALLESSSQLVAHININSDGFGGYSWGTLAAVTAVVGIAVALSTPRADAEEDPLPPIVYDRDDIADYWSQRPVAVARRSFVVASEALKWGSGLALDMARGAVKQNRRARAAALRQGLERLGPAYVKVAQAVSTRVDLLEPEYLAEIELLQDRVPPFPNELAELAMLRAYGRPSSQVYERLSPSPLAAASLGQVYRGRLQPQYGGAEVAVKVQRPGVLLSVAMDMFLMRNLAVLLDSLFKTTWTGIIDEWAGRFFDELDYSREAQNAIIFKEQMAALEGIKVPDVFPELCSQEVLTTAWVEGEKLSESNATDVRELCNTLLNCYLIQLLETGFLHADPHPGNLLRTPDGKICILDYGLMTRISPNRSIALVEYIAHLTTEDYESIPGDLYKLGFIPDGAPDPIESGLVQPLSKILRQLAQGGGARAINIDEVTGEMEELTRDYPFQIPSYFALILRAFSVIEGIALRADPSYAIVQECFPYLSRRLFTDNDPRVRASLQQMLYGEKKRLDIARLQRMATGFGSFTVDGLKAAPVDAVAGDQPILNSTSKEALRTLFRAEGSYIQEVFVEESAAAVDAVGREIASEISRRLLGSPPAVATMSFAEALGPLRPFFLPVLTPLELLNRVAPRIAPTEEDQQALATARTLFGLLQGSSVPTAQPMEPRQLQFAAQLARELQPLLPELLPGMVATGDQFARAMIRRLALRIADEAGKPPGPASRPSSSRRSL